MTSVVDGIGLSLAFCFSLGLAVFRARGPSDRIGGCLLTSELGPSESLEISIISAWYLIPVTLGLGIRGKTGKAVGRYGDGEDGRG